MFRLQDRLLRNPLFARLYPKLNARIHDLLSVDQVDVKLWTKCQIIGSDVEVSLLDRPPSNEHVELVTQLIARLKDTQHEKVEEHENAKIDYYETELQALQVLLPDKLREQSDQLDRAKSVLDERLQQVETCISAYEEARTPEYLASADEHKHLQQAVATALGDIDRLKTFISSPSSLVPNSR